MITIITKSPNLIVRRFVLEDLDGYHLMEGDAETVRHTGIRTPNSREVTSERLHKMIGDYKKDERLGVFGVALKEIASEIIGLVMLKDTGFEFPELGFMFQRAHWGKGYATEVSEAMCQYGFETCGLNTIIARADSDNLGSQRVLEKLQFQKVDPLKPLKPEKKIPREDPAEGVETLFFTRNA